MDGGKIICILLSITLAAHALVTKTKERYRRLVKSTDADIRQWTSHASLEYKPSVTMMWKTCSATLIESRWLLTAAHCVRDAQENDIRPEDFYVKIRENPSSWDTTRYVVTHVITPMERPDLTSNWSILDHDIALIRLEMKAPAYMERVLYKNGATDLRNCKIAGWGATQPMTLDDYSNGNYQLANKLQQIDGDVLNFEQYCKGVNPDKKLCFGRLGADDKVETGACVGDSGSPLVCDTNYGRTIVGVSVGGSGECQPITVAVTDVRDYVDWIREKRNEVMAMI